MPRWHAVQRKAEVPGCLRSPDTEEASPPASPRESRSRSPKQPKRVVRLTLGRGRR